MAVQTEEGAAGVGALCLFDRLIGDKTWVVAGAALGGAVLSLQLPVRQRRIVVEGGLSPLPINRFKLAPAVFRVTVEAVFAGDFRGCMVAFSCVNAAFQGIVTGEAFFVGQLFAQFVAACAGGDAFQCDVIAG